MGPPSGTYDCSYADGTFAAARFVGPSGMGISPDGETIYVADWYDNKIRAIDRTTQTTTTIVGSGTQGYAESSSISTQMVYRVKQVCLLALHLGQSHPSSLFAEPPPGAEPHVPPEISCPSVTGFGPPAR